MKRNLLALLLSFLFLTGCKKDEETGDSQMPAIKLMAPINNQAFASGQTIHITATISDNSVIREVHLEIINTTTGVFLTHEHYTPNAGSYELSKTFVAQANSSYKIKVEAEDGSRNNAKSEVSVISN
jgi:hypothetical protein